MQAEEYIQSLCNLPMAERNRQIEQVCGVVDFFTTENEMALSATDERSDKFEYGDWQTNEVLTQKVVQLIKEDYTPNVIIEPTCGKGNFVMAALDAFDTVTEIYALEIYEPYVQQLKMRILQDRLDKGCPGKAKIHIMQGDIFHKDWSDIRQSVQGKRTLVLGNPPWVTSTELGKNNSKNLPKKTNFKHLNGLSAITGKSNFDIAEYICYILISQFSGLDVRYALLLKNSVIRQICYNHPLMRLPIHSLTQYKIDTKKEFRASVDASLFVSANGEGGAVCNVYDFYNREYLHQYGWEGGKFVANVKTYKYTAQIDGISPIVWRSGIKHDCQSVLELRKEKETYYNKLGEIVDIEDACIFPYAKSSDIQKGITNNHSRFVIITQRHVNDDTNQLQYTHPKTFTYLQRHIDYFNQRKSSIYKKNSPFCIFGIGEYTFKPYKILISGLYKSAKFTLIPPVNGKCIIPDDTCYMTGFDSLEEAQAILQLLNCSVVNNFLCSISFTDAKRIITKDSLMRINLNKVHPATPRPIPLPTIGIKQQLQF